MHPPLLANRMGFFYAPVYLSLLHTPPSPQATHPFPLADNVISAYEPHHLVPYRAWTTREQGG